MHEGN